MRGRSFLSAFTVAALALVGQIAPPMVAAPVLLPGSSKVEHKPRRYKRAMKAKAFYRKHRRPI